MNSLLIHPTSHCSLGRENSDFSVSSFYDCLCSGNRHAEDMPPDEYLLLEPPQCMHARSIAREDDDISSSGKELLDSYSRQYADLFSGFPTVWSMFPVHLEDHLYIGKLFLKSLHDELPTES
jgi:hypothetical protein